MELPRRQSGDEFLPNGSFSRLRDRLSSSHQLADVRALFIYAFDFRTRVGPFVYFDKLLIPGAPLSIGAALKSVGINQLRLVLQQWTPNVLPSQTQINGRPPDLLLVSSMQIHSAASYELIRDAWRLGDDRPLILAGGSKAIYEPWDYFGLDESGNCGADVVVTGEEYVVLELLEVLAAHRGQNESLRQAFDRVRREGLLDRIPGLVFRPEAPSGPTEELMHTGIQRLVQDLDELPSVTTVLDHFEPPHRNHSLSNRTLPGRRLSRHSKIAALVTTHGCKFRCSYCPIPGYNQFTFRHKSSERLADDMGRFYEQTGINMFFGTDDNLFNSRSSIEEMFTGLTSARLAGKRLMDVVSWATEATEFDVWKNRDLLPLARKAGLRLIWFGVEDMTAELIKKGQNPDKTRNLFRELLAHGIGPMPMMMHHDGQPLYSRGSLYGLLNQARFLRRSGAFSFQVTFLTPSVGSKGYEKPFEDGMVFRQVDDTLIEDRHYDGNHCIATHDDQPWRKQLNMLIAYLYFYNPAGMLRDAFRFDELWLYRLIHQMFGNLRVIRSLPRDLKWIWKLYRGPRKRAERAPSVNVRIRHPKNVDEKLVHYGLAQKEPVSGAQS